MVNGGETKTVSSGQKPRWPQYFPAMKVRNKKRRRPVRVTVWDGWFNPVWPPVVEGVDLRNPWSFTFSGEHGIRTLNTINGYWEVDG